MKKLRPFFEYELYVPTISNENYVYGKALLGKFKSALIEHFGGMTDFHYRNEGTWKMGNTVFHDEIIIYRVLTKNRAAARKFLSLLKKQMEKDLQQEEILIVERNVLIL